MPALRVYKTTVTESTAITLRVHKSQLVAAAGGPTLRVYRSELDTTPVVSTLQVYKTTVSSTYAGSHGFWVWKASTGQWVEGTPYFWDSTAGAWRLL